MKVFKLLWLALFAAIAQVLAVEKGTVGGDVTVTLTTAPDEGTLTLTKDGIPVLTSKYTLTTKDVKIENLKTSDSGKYEAKYKAATVDKTETFDVQVWVACAATGTTSDCVGIEGGFVKITGGDATWTNPQVTGSRVNVVSDNTLEITDLQTSDSGKCSSKNAAVSSNLRVFAEYKGGKGHALNLTLSTEATTFLVLRHGETKVDASKYVASKKNLTIKNPELSDSGKYTAEHKSSASGVATDPKDYFEITIVESYEGVSGEDITVTLKEAPKDNVVHLIKKEKPKGNKYTLVSTTKYSVTGKSLKIKKPIVSDNGIYTIEYTKSDDSKPTQEGFALHLTQTSTPSGGAGAGVKIKPQSDKARLGQTFKLRCEVTGRPGDNKFTWLKNDNEIPNNANIEFSGNAMTFKGVQIGDKGLYTCTHAGVTSKPFKLDIGRAVVVSYSVGLVLTATLASLLLWLLM